MRRETALKEAIYLLTLFSVLIGCSNDPPPTSDLQKTQKPNPENIDISTAHRSNRIVFESDSCANSNFRAILEGNLTLGLGTLRLRIYSPKNKLLKDELLNVPVDRCAISYCENDYAVVGFACGGPCYSHLFVFKDERKTQQFAFAQRVSNNPNLVAHIKDEIYEKLYIFNLNNQKEMVLDISDSHWLANNNHMDTIYVSNSNLIVEYMTKKNPKRRRSVSLKNIL